MDAESVDPKGVRISLFVSFAAVIACAFALSVESERYVAYPLLVVLGASITNLVVAFRHTGIYMRSDTRARLISEANAANDGLPRKIPGPVVFSGTVQMVVIEQTICADTVHMTGKPTEEIIETT